MHKQNKITDYSRQYRNWMGVMRFSQSNLYMDFVLKVYSPEYLFETSHKSFRDEQESKLWKLHMSKKKFKYGHLP